MNNLSAVVTEQELKSKAVAPRVTLDYLESQILSADFRVVDTLTLCVLTLQNGFKVTGESACADSANYNQEIGQRLAREDAKRKIWGLLGYELRSKLKLVEVAGAMTGCITSLPGVQTYVGTKVVHAGSCTRAAYNHLRNWVLPADENGDDEGYLVQYTDGGQQNVPGFDGYVSWSPKAVFEVAYQSIGGVVVAPSPVLAPKVEAQNAACPPSTWLDRAKVEHAELGEKLEKLLNFKETPLFQKLVQADRDDLEGQLHGMEVYYYALGRRMRRAESGLTLRPATATLTA